MSTMKTTRDVKGVGVSIPRPDGPEKVTGRVQYVADIQPKGLLHAKLLRSPHAHAKIVSIDTSAAKALPGVRAVYMGTNVNGRNLSDPALFPVFERCQALGLPIGLHPFNVNGAERLRAYYLTNLLGNPYDTGIAAAHLIFGGVLDRLPKLQVILPHAGGTVPLVWGRLQRGQKVRPEANRAARKPVRAYLRRFTYDTISHDPGALRYLIDTVGADRVMLGTDFCFDMGYEKPLDIIRDRSVKLSRADQAKVIRDNAARLLRLR